METLYFDVLQFLYHVALAVLVGGALALGTAAAPAIFARARSRAEAGTIFAAALARFDGAAILAVIVIAVTSVLKAGAFEVTGIPEPRLVARWLALAALCIATLYSSAWANPVARSIRAATSGFDDLPADAPARLEFAALHARSRRAMSAAVFIGLVAISLS